MNKREWKYLAKVLLEESRRLEFLSQQNSKELKNRSYEINQLRKRPHKAAIDESDATISRQSTMINCLNRDLANYQKGT